MNALVPAEQNKIKPIYIIIPTINNYDYLKMCIESIAANTIDYFRFIIVNNGNKELDNLISLSGSKLIYTGKNLGWAGGINKGLEAIDEDCDYVLFMNDDTLILPGDYDWLWKMKQTMENDKTIGALGPSSNCVMGLQNIAHPVYINRLIVKYLIGFCVMVRKKAFDEIGRMDENLPGGDDFDWSIRFRKAGYKLLARRDIFIHHFGFKTGDRLFTGYWNSPKYQEEVNFALIKKHGFKEWVETTARGHLWIEPYELGDPEYENENFNKVELPFKNIIKGRGIDVGCGARKVHPDAIGVDIAQKGQLLGTQGGNDTEISVGDICASGDNLHMFKDNELDYVIARHNLEHYDNPIKTLREWKRVLKPEGHLGLMLPDGGRLNTIRLNENHKHSFDRQGLRDLLELVGFKVIELGETINRWDMYAICEKDGLNG